LVEFGGQFWDVFCLTFPDNEDFPSGVANFSEIAFVTLDVSKPFFLPEFFACGWYNFSVTAAVNMPEASMNKDDGLCRIDNDIRLADD